MSENSKLEQFYTRIKNHERRLGITRNPSWYRGHSHGKYQLTPAILRRKNGLKHETNLFAVFQSEGKQYLPNFRNSWELLAIMQQYGVPTRLLSWTDSLYTAIFFAISYNKHETPCIWILNPFKLNLKSTGKNVIYDDTDKLIADYYEVISSNQESLESLQNSQKDITSIPPELYARLRTTLLECGPFDNDHNLRAIFVDARINPWRNKLIESNNPMNRVEAVIEILRNKYNERQENALVLLLHVLNERLDPNDSCYRRLNELSSDLESKLKASTSSWPYDLPIAIAPTWTNERIKAQRVYFTFHGNVNEPLEVMCKSCVKRVTIPPELVRTFKRELNKSGIDHYRLFPDLYGLACSLRAKFRFE